MLIVFVRIPLWISSSIRDKNMVMFFFLIHSLRALRLLINLLFILELFKVIVQNTELFALESFEFYIESGWGLVNSPVKICVIVGKLLLFILFEP